MRLKMIVLLIIVASGLMACDVGDNGTQSVSAPLIAFRDGEPEFEEIGREKELINNCGANAETRYTVEKSETIAHTLEVGQEVGLSVDGMAAPGGVGVNLGASVATHYGYQYGTEQSIARSVDVGAKEGTCIEHEIVLLERWEVGEAVVTVGNGNHKIPYRFRTDFRVRKGDSQELGCPCSQKLPPTRTPKPTETRIPPTETPIPPTSTPILTPTPQRIADSPTALPTRSPQSFADMILIPAGEFTMGSTQAQVDAAFEQCKKSYGDGCKKEWFEREMPQHTVNLGEYFIDKYETTNAQYAECVKAGKCTAPHKTKSYSRANYYGNAEFANYPVIYIDWTQAKSYCEFAGKRLPTEAEWEKAARGTDGRTYPWGNEFDGKKLNYCDKNCTFDWADKAVDDGYADTAPVGSYPSGASPYGVMDMAGNVWEWVSSDYKSYPYVANDGREELLSNNNKMFRGGSWNYLDNFTRAAFRDSFTSTDIFNYLGVRCAQ